MVAYRLLQSHATGKTGTLQKEIVAVRAASPVITRYTHRAVLATHGGNFWEVL
jgi:hypothetical protein